MTEITVTHWVRHGEVENPKKILPGRLPGFHLSANGKKQAQQTAIYLKHYPIRSMYTSPMDRCLETARVIQQTIGKLPIITEPNLTEIKTPREGEPLTRLEKDKFNFFKSRFLKKGGETIEEILQRTLSSLNAIIRDNNGRDVIIVTHGDSIMFLKMKLLWKRVEFSLSRGPFYPSPASILSLSFNESRTLIQSSEVIFYHV